MIAIDVMGLISDQKGKKRELYPHINKASVLKLRKGLTTLQPKVQIILLYRASYTVILRLSSL